MKLEACKPGDYADFGGDSIVILDADDDFRRVAVIHGSDKEATEMAQRFIAAQPAPSPDAEWLSRTQVECMDSHWHMFKETPREFVTFRAEELHALCRMALALLDRQEGWRDISTAPKDGTAILLMCNDWPGIPGGHALECNGHNTYVAAWWTSEWVCYMDVPSEPRLPIEPTHWQPLPPAPSSGGEKL